MLRINPLTNLRCLCFSKIFHFAPKYFRLHQFILVVVFCETEFSRKSAMQFSSSSRFVPHWTLSTITLL
nr:hypothetical transcript [Hymenolepis microstoma]